MTGRGAVLGLLAGALGGGFVMGLAYAPSDGVATALYLVAWGSSVLVAVQVLMRRRHRAVSLSGQLAAGVMVSAGLSLLGIGAIVLLMFISTHDALVIAVVLLFGGALSAYSVWALSRGVLHDVRTVRDGLRAVGKGRRDIDLHTGAQDELAELAAAATAMAARLSETESEREATDQARRKLVAAVSHDLRTPLTSLRLISDAITDEVVDPATRRGYLEQMSVHIRSLSALIDDLFELSRIEAGDIDWSMEQVRLHELVSETVEAMQPHADAKRVRVVATVAGDLATARANPERVQRVLFNLIQNAIRHTPADGSVTVVAEANGRSVEVEVADTGEGLAQDDRALAFDAFYRGSSGPGHLGDGTGLGLTICRAIVEAHGGRIWFAEAPVGTCVRFSLPRG